MKLLVAIIVCAMFLAGIVYAEEMMLNTQKDKISYSIGLDAGKNLKKQEIDINPEVLAKGLKDGLSGAKPLMTDQEVQETMTSFRNELMSKQQDRIKMLAEKNKKEGEAFLSENKKKEGIKTTKSGLQYKVIKEGTGKTPKADDTVTVNYRGTLIDGTEFDSSYKRGEAATFPVTGVIAGWTEVLQLMKEGSKWQLFIPSNLAYGERGAGGVIGPFAVLIFEVELVSVTEK
ncbi:MAG: FKBP-type peptidyl-prolyl cis-trans isomerase [Nitrospirae bacterium]|nr:FKBP-type peptidyl-prolyl cis-trans isomerase [Nitrospirota bacterium]